MSNDIPTAYSTIGQSMRNAETMLDEAMIAYSGLLAEMLKMRRNLGLSMLHGHDAVAHCAHTISGLAEARGHGMRSHKAGNITRERLGREATAVGDCCSSENPFTTSRNGLSVVA